MQVLEEKIVGEHDLPDNLKKILDTFPGFVWCSSSEGSIFYIKKD